MKNKLPWNKTTSILVIIFLVLFIFMLSKESKAESNVEIYSSTAFVGGEHYNSEAIIFSETWDNRKYQAGLALQLSLTCTEKSPCKRGESKSANQAFYIKRNVYYGDFYMSMGLSYWANKTPAWNSHTPYMLGMGYHFDKFTINYTHFSTGGSSSNNGGLDFITIGYTF